MFKISVSREKNPTTSSTAQIQLYVLTAGTQLSVFMVQSQLLNWLFFKILKFSVLYIDLRSGRAVKIGNAPM